jgi:hypothetical protein
MFDRILKKRSIVEGESFDSNAGHYEPSRDLLYSNMFAGMLAYEQDALLLDVPHMIGGIYLGHDETPRYWDAPRQLRTFLSTECILGWPKWFYYGQLYEHLRRNRKPRFLGKRIQRTKVLREVLEEARRYCESRNSRGRSGKPLMIPEDLLLAMAQRTDLPICDELAKSGLVIDRLRSVVTHSKDQD